ncbi:MULTISPECIES: hypothetical protein [unclassified Leifsonia]|uniref:hypothetical protein n=1 Tax=unclassified Leifsonia TaxID=2663824 RepID=UPI0006F9F456|nr:MULTISPECIES: hypothetical protein [unclassified Leifsonia]KQX08010.1 hypothetical protein ASC59_09975 [Leifsonia sp. Root1293]KRA12291.1 hypothetical protein ASD61_09975 [Leifsonia sp. Root60]
MFRYTQTDHGPMLEGSSGERLKSLLVEYESLLHELGGPENTGMRPGVPREITQLALAQRGLKPVEEILVWFEWHDGIQRGATRPLGDFPPMVLASLAESLDRYDEARVLLEHAYEDEMDYSFVAWGAGEGWLRLENEGMSVAVDCTGAPDVPPRVRRTTPDFDYPGTEGWNRATSLCTPVARWIESARDGAFTWDPDIEMWRIDESLFKSDLTHSRLG